MLGFLLLQWDDLILFSDWCSIYLFSPHHAVVRTHIWPTNRCSALTRPNCVLALILCSFEMTKSRKIYCCCFSVLSKENVKCCWYIKPKHSSRSVRSHTDFVVAIQHGEIISMLHQQMPRHLNAEARVFFCFVFDFLFYK